MFHRGMMHGAQSLFSPLSFVFLQAFLAPLLASEVTNKMFSDCSPTVDICGSNSVNISYPFRVPSMPDYCGHPSFELKCIENRSTWEIDIGRVTYQIDYLDYHYQVLNVVNLQFLGNSCPQMFTNTTFDLSLFNYTEKDLNLTLYVNCSPLTLPSDLGNVTCLTNNGYQSYYRLPYNDGSQPLAELVGSCSSVILIPMYAFNAGSLVNGRLDFLGVLQYGFDLMWMVGKGWCMECKASGGACGYDSSFPNAPACFCPYGSSTTGNCFSKGTKVKKNKRKVIIGFTIGSIGFILACLLFLHFIGRQTRFCNLIIFWKKNLKNDQNIEAFLKKHGSLAPKRYMYSDVKKITKNFHDKLGQGGYGTVFKGILSDGHIVAVKVLSDFKGNGEEFINEVASIGKTSHVNIVSLLGFCFEGSKRALIYDFVCNGSLENFIYLEKTTLRWERLYQISIGIARGLEYLHRGCNTKIVHFDIKPQNILLDQYFCPKIADFGLAQLCPQKDSILSVAGTRGTIGYIAPEVFCRSFGVVSSKSDVYSYGMMVLEMVGVRKNRKNSVENSSESYFPHWIYEHLDQSGGLQGLDVTDETAEIARKMILVGLWCIQTLPQNRPPISRVLDMLEGSIDEIQVPPKPYLSSPVQSNIDEVSSVS